MKLDAAPYEQCVPAVINHQIPRNYSTIACIKAVSQLMIYDWMVWAINKLAGPVTFFQD